MNAEQEFAKLSPEAQKAINELKALPKVEQVSHAFAIMLIAAQKLPHEQYRDFVAGAVDWFLDEIRLDAVMVTVKADKNKIALTGLRLLDQLEASRRRMSNLTELLKP